MSFVSITPPNIVEYVTLTLRTFEHRYGRVDVEENSERERDETCGAGAEDCESGAECGETRENDQTEGCGNEGDDTGSHEIATSYCDCGDEVHV